MTDLLELDVERERPSKSGLKDTMGLPSFAQSTGYQWTPPPTPAFGVSQRDDLLAEDQGSNGFHNYLRAFYPYHPASTISSGEADESSVTVPINQGDIILVHSVQPNGWADGTLLASGARGWLPTNYCEPYSPNLMHNLLDALTYTWEFIRGHEEDDFQIFIGQDYVRGMIAGVRLLLQRTNCLSRDELFIKNVHSLRRARRYMLSDLSSFSKAAATLQEACQTPDLSRDTFYELLDDIVLRAFRVTTKATKFLDIWAHHVGQRVDEDTPPLTPPVIISEAPDDTNGIDSERQGASRTSFRLSTYAQLTASASNVESATWLLEPHAFDSPGVPLSPPARSTRPTSFLQKRVSASHRLSYSARCPSIRDREFASDTLSAAHDAFLSSLGVFTGLHLQSRASMELLTETRQAVHSCSALLVVIEDIMLRDLRHSRTLDDAKEQLQRSLAALIQTIGAQSSDDDDMVMTSYENPPIQAATSCVRSASVCVAEANAVIERVGDFEINKPGHETSGLSNTSTVAPTAAGQQERPGPLIIEEGFEMVEKPLPTSPPPPSPPSQSEKQYAHSEDCSRLSPFGTTTFGVDVPRPSLDSRVSFDTIVRPASSSAMLNDAGSRKAPSLELDIPPMSPICFPDVALGSSAQQSPPFELNSRGVSFAGTSSTDFSSFRSSKVSVESESSTVATTPDQSPVRERTGLGLLGSFGSLADSQSTLADDTYDEETNLLATTYAHELILNQDGHIVGGSLPALVERLTVHDVTPDAMFVNTFYLTFRQFCRPVQFATCLADRFSYVESSPAMSRPVRLRIYNVLKGWLELHWRCDSDNEAIPVIEQLAQGPINVALPTASQRLLELTEKAAQNAGTAPRVVSLQGKANAVIGSTVDWDTPIPSPVVSKSQLALLKKTELKTATCSILDFEPLELARQFTLIESRIFCQITPDELLDCEWHKPAGTSRAVNVKAIAKLSTDLANLVTDTILQYPEAKKRAAVVKQWVKIAKKCRELSNYDSVSAIISALNSSMVSRLKKTWDIVSPKTRARLEEMRPPFEGRMAGLRKLLENHGAPCIPFVGMTLTDLTMNHEANPRKRKLGRGLGAGESIGSSEEQYVINFDRYVKTARFIGDLQRFQVPYHLAPVPEMQRWMEAQIQRVRGDLNATPQAYYRRSLIIEPRELQQQPMPKLSPEIQSAHTSFSSMSSDSTTTEKPMLSSKSSFWNSLGLPQGMHIKDKIVS